MTTNPTETPRRGGRPRPLETVRRDAAILSMLDDCRDGLTTAAVAEELGITVELVRVAMARLKGAGQVRRVLGENGESMWQRRSGS